VRVAPAAADRRGGGPRTDDDAHAHARSPRPGRRRLAQAVAVPAAQPADAPEQRAPPRREPPQAPPPLPRGRVTARRGPGGAPDHCCTVALRLLRAPARYRSNQPRSPAERQPRARPARCGRGRRSRRCPPDCTVAHHSPRRPARFRPTHVLYVKRRATCAPNFHAGSCAPSTRPLERMIVEPVGRTDPSSSGFGRVHRHYGALEGGSLLRVTPCPSPRARRLGVL
jgi:hypothetical protein